MRNKNKTYQKIKILVDKLQEQERRRTSGKEAALRYENIHHDRFQKTVKICRELVPPPDAQVLDVGPSYLTTLLARAYHNVSTLGLDTATDDGGQRSNSTLALSLPHITFELNNSRDIEHWPRVTKRFDFIVLAETLEHIHTAPEYSLIYLSSLLNENGLLLVTTPNAATIMKRLILLLKGKNPYEHIRLNAENPGHYREYTMKELIDIGIRCQLQPVYTRHINFYTAADFLQGFLKRLYPSFKDSIVIAFRKK
jgi:2-polyprenyl-3-methyl-5-hydroxy-6-metoxy-1,4-benzoquinol methylase